MRLAFGLLGVRRRETQSADPDGEEWVNKNLLRQLADRKAIVRMPHGEYGVRVLLQYPAARTANTFRKMRQVLQARFQELAKENPSIWIDVDGIAVVEQRAKGVLPFGQFEQLVKILHSHQIDVRINGRLECRHTDRVR